MRRFYALSTQPTLFGETSLVRNWGRISTSGKTMVQTFRWSCGRDRSVRTPGACQAEARSRCHGRKTVLV
ncbi:MULTISPECIES: WGR domain-containing protein [unclassified Bradyrhizobium]|uniref:WGR domain-containing protein n=1 Tax=unclassified Bradyrhizobium TaxID=2631580 RepID=UPI003394486C